MAGLAYGNQTLGALARAGNLEALERKMRWESKSPNDPVRAFVRACWRDQHYTRPAASAGQQPAAPASSTSQQHQPAAPASSTSQQH
jgi:hypothetical protein